MAALPQRVLIVENSRSYAGMLAEAMEERARLPVVLARTMAEAETALAANPDIFLVLSGLVLPDASQDAIIDRFAPEFEKLTWLTLMLPWFGEDE